MQMLDRPIAYHRVFVRLGTGCTGAIFLSQALYWTKRTNQDGWFYKTQADWEEETGLTRYEQETARKKLKSLGALEEVKRGVPCKVYYRVNAEKLDFLLNQLAESQHVEKPHTGSQSNNTTACGKATDSVAVKPQTITETTQRLPETTTEIIADSKKSAKPSAKKSGSKRCALPNDFTPTQQHIELANNSGIDLNHEFEQFKDYHKAKDSKMVDWHAALRTWIRNAAKFAKGKPANKNRQSYMRNDFNQIDYSKGINEDGTF
tara:strand:- start:13897 stop:14682 length:786 start_codon:yes stop_codon:yes gene_type:complete